MSLSYMMCKVVNIRKEQYDVYIGRHMDPVKGKWGNPYSSKDGTLAEFKVSSKKEAIDMYEKHLLSSVELMKQLHTLKYKRLGCFCKPKSCHGDVIKKYVDRLEQLDRALF